MICINLFVLVENDFRFFAKCNLHRIHWERWAEHTLNCLVIGVFLSLTYQTDFYLVVLVVILIIFFFLISKTPTRKVRLWLIRTILILIIPDGRTWLKVRSNTFSQGLSPVRVFFFLANNTIMNMLGNFANIGLAVLLATWSIKLLAGSSLKLCSFQYSE